MHCKWSRRSGAWRAVFSLSLGGLLLSGCETTTTPIAERAIEHTLLGNPKLPAKELELFYQGENAKMLKNLPYSSYVIFRGSIERDGSINLRKVWDAYPDESRTEVARAFASAATVAPSSVGGRVRPTAEVYVIFYDYQDAPGGRALIFAQQTTGDTTVVRRGGNHYLLLANY